MCHFTEVLLKFYWVLHSCWIFCGKNYTFCFGTPTLLQAFMHLTLTPTKKNNKPLRIAIKLNNVLYCNVSLFELLLQ